MMKWCPMNRDEICLLLTDKIKQLKNNENKLNDLLPDIRLLYGSEHGVRTPVMYQLALYFSFQDIKLVISTSVSFAMMPTNTYCSQYLYPLNVKRMRHRTFRWLVSA